MPRSPTRKPALPHERRPDTSHETDVPLGPGRPVGRDEVFVLAAMGIVCLAFWLAHYHYFYVPNADYFSFDRAAGEIWSGRLPSSTKRMPVFPFLMGLVAKALPVEHPQLHAALVLNLAFSLGSLALIYLIARVWLGWMALLPTVLLAASDAFSRWCLQPIVEPSLGFFVLLTVLLFQRRSRWQYAAAGAAALARYEAAALLPILVLLNLAYPRREPGAARLRERLGHIVGGAVASFPVAAWIVYMLRQGEARSPYRAWAREGPLARLNPEVLLTLLQDPFGVRLYRHEEGFVWPPFVALSGVLLAGLLASVGWPAAAWRRWRPQRRVSLALLLFLGAYAGVHLSFGINRSRYAYPTNWILILYFSIGAVALVQWAAARLAPRKSEAWALVLGMLLFVAALIAFVRGARRILGVEAVRPAWVYIAFAAVLAALATLFVALRLKRRSGVMLAAAGAVALLVGHMATDHVYDVAKGSRKVRDMKSEYRAAGLWLRAHLRPGERAVMLNTEIAQFYSDLPRGSILNLSALNVPYDKDVRTTLRRLVEAMRARSIRYLIFTPRRGLYAEKEPTKGYYMRFKTYLLRPFVNGATPPGFRRLARLQMAADSERTPSYVYELLSNAPPEGMPPD